MTVETIEVKKLVKSPLNVRKTVSKTACDELKASILAHGLMQNLVVVPAKKGKFHVIAGARRLEALQALIAEGKLPEDHAVPCQIAAEEQAQELSLAENTVRLAMHPADEFEAFAALVEKGETAEQIGQRFGKTEKHVLQRLKLGRVAPELLEEYRKGNLKLEVLEAFTITDDRKRQLKVYKAIKNGWQIHHPREIRGLLTETAISSTSKLARFVGVDAYEAAGGAVRRDLFAEECYLENPELLHSLADDKLNRTAEELKEEGWSWVEVSHDRDYQIVHRCDELEKQPADAPQELLDKKAAIEAELKTVDQQWDEMDAEDEAFDALDSRLAELQKRQQELSEQVEEYGVFTSEQKATAGCYVYISHNGELVIREGLVRLDDQAGEDSEEAEVADGDEDDTDGSAGEDDSEEYAPAKPSLSQALVDDLKAYRTQVAQVAMAENPTIAFDLLVMTAAKNVIRSLHNFDGADVLFRQSHPRPSGEEKTAATERLEAIREALPLAWMREKTEAAQLAAFQQLDDADKHRILAYCTAMTLQPKLAPTAGKQRTFYDAALAQTGVNVAEYWRPTEANFLKRVNIALLLEIGDRVLGAMWVSYRRNAKKTALAAELAKAFADPQTHGKSTEQVEALTHWLPEGMGFGAEEPAAAAEAA